MERRNLSYEKSYLNIYGHPSFNDRRLLIRTDFLGDERIISEISVKRPRKVKTKGAFGPSHRSPRRRSEQPQKHTYIDVVLGPTPDTNMKLRSKKENNTKLKIDETLGATLGDEILGDNRLNADKKTKTKKRNNSKLKDALQKGGNLLAIGLLTLGFIEGLTSCSGKYIYQVNEYGDRITYTQPLPPTMRPAEPTPEPTSDPKMFPPIPTVDPELAKGKQQAQIYNFRKCHKVNTEKVINNDGTLSCEWSDDPNKSYCENWQEGIADTDMITKPYTRTETIDNVTKVLCNETYIETAIQKCELSPDAREIVNGAYTINYAKTENCGEMIKQNVPFVMAGSKLIAQWQNESAEEQARWEDILAKADAEIKIIEEQRRQQEKIENAKEGIKVAGTIVIVGGGVLLLFTAPETLAGGIKFVSVGQALFSAEQVVVTSAVVGVKTGMDMDDGKLTKEEIVTNIAAIPISLLVSGIILSIFGFIVAASKA